MGDQLDSYLEEYKEAFRKPNNMLFQIIGRKFNMIGPSEPLSNIKHYNSQDGLLFGIRSELLSPIYLFLFENLIEYGWSYYYLEQSRTSFQEEITEWLAIYDKPQHSDEVGYTRELLEGSIHEILRYCIYRV